MAGRATITQMQNKQKQKDQKTQKMKLSQNAVCDHWPFLLSILISHLVFAGFHVPSLKKNATLTRFLLPALFCEATERQGDRTPG